MNESIHKKVRLSSEQVRQLPSFKKARRAIFKLQIEEGRAHGRGRTSIPRILIPRARIRAHRSPACARRATTDSGGDDGGGDPEPPRRPYTCSLPAYCGGAA